MQIEGEAGFGKPEEQRLSARHGELGVSARETWMVGDNLEWEVVAPQRLGIFAVWFDHRAKGLPEGSEREAELIVTSLTRYRLGMCRADHPSRQPLASTKALWNSGV